MKELSLHILDLSENSIAANADVVNIRIKEDLALDLMTIEIEDNGKGMTQDYIRNVTNPFITTRKTRNVGLGISLTKAATQRCGGDFYIESQEGKGTKVKATFKHSHIDRAPLGDIGQTIVSLINNMDGIDINYTHIFNDKEFLFQTGEIKKMLVEVDIKSSKILLWIRDYVNSSIKNLYNDK